MATKREKQLVILLLKERIEHVTGKKVILKENNKRILKEETELDSNTLVKILVKVEKDYNRGGDLVKKTFKGPLSSVLKNILDTYGFGSEDVKSWSIDMFLKRLNDYNGEVQDYILSVTMIDPEIKILYEAESSSEDY